MTMKNTNTKLRQYKKSKVLDDDYIPKGDLEDIINEEIIDDEEEVIDVEEDIEEDDDEIIDEKEEIKEIIEEIVSDKPKKRGRKSNTSSEYYVEPNKFDAEIMSYYDTGVISNELADMISKISHKLSYAKNFINYSYREEMVGDGVIRMMKALIAKKYDREKGTNPFSYFTRIAFNAFRNRIKKEKHIHETHEKYKRELMFMSEQFNNLSKNNNIHIMRERNRQFE